MSGEARARMVDEQIAARGIADPRVLAALREVPREAFVPAQLRGQAFVDGPLPIGHGATISQPFVVAHMSELAQLKAGDRVLEIGTGSGYQAAVLAALGAEVYSIERVAALYETARERLDELGYRVSLRHGDGANGWPEAGPFRAIVLTAAPTQIPAALLEQLAVGGRLIAPVGPPGWQSLRLVERGDDGVSEREVAQVAFVPMLPGLG